MRIRDLIKDLLDRSEDYDYVSLDPFNMNNICLSNTDDGFISPLFFMTLFSESGYDKVDNDKELIEHIDYENIEVEIQSFEISKDEKTGRLITLYSVKPTKELPTWYDLDCQLEDFSEVKEYQLCDNTFWLPVNSGKNYISF